MAFRAVCQWLVEREDVVRWVRLCMTCKDTMEVAQQKLKEERAHKVAVLDWAFGQLSKDLDHLTITPLINYRFRNHLINMRDFVHETMAVSEKWDEISGIEGCMRGALNALMADIQELTDRPLDALARMDIGRDAERLADLKYVWRVFTRNIALRRVPTAGGPVRP
jgi:hypothetical protein